MADKIVVCGAGDSAKQTIFIDHEGLVEIKVDSDGVHLVFSDPDVLAQLGSVLEGLKAD